MKACRELNAQEAKYVVAGSFAIRAAGYVRGCVQASCGMSGCLRMVFFGVSMLFLSGCGGLDNGGLKVSHERIKLRNMEFKCVHQGIEVTCVSASVKGNTGGYYALFEGGKFARLVDRPRARTYSTVYEGTRWDREVAEESQAKALKILTARAVSVEGLPFDERPDPRRQPMNVLPAFVIAAPLLIPAGVVSDLTDENAVVTLERKGVVLGASWEMVIEKLGRGRVKIDEREQVIRYGPGIELVYRSAVIRFKEGKVSGIYTGEFYAEL